MLPWNMFVVNAAHSLVTITNEKFSRDSKDNVIKEDLIMYA